MRTSVQAVNDCILKISQSHQYSRYVPTCLANLIRNLSTVIYLERRDKHRTICDLNLVHGEINIISENRCPGESPG